MSSTEPSVYEPRQRLRPGRWLGRHWKTSLAFAAGTAVLLLNQRVAPPGEPMAALAGARTAEAAAPHEPAVPQQVRAAPTDKPGAAIDARDFLERALRDPGRLTRIDFKSRPATAYCLVDPQSHEILECLRRPALSGEVLASLNRAHRRSGDRRFWRVDARRSSVQACRTVKPAGSALHRLLCRPLKVAELPFPPPPPPPAPLPALRSGEIEVACTSPWPSVPCRRI